MMWFAKQAYSPLSNFDLDLISKEVIEEKISPQKRMSICQFLPWVAHLFFLFTSTSLFISAVRLNKLEGTCSVGPESTHEYVRSVSECGEFDVFTEFSGELGAPSVFRGSPNPELDDMWNKVTNVGAMSVSRDEIQRVGKFRNSSVLIPTTPGGYMASTAVIHQLHCLDLLRKYSYLDYYSKKEPHFFNAPTLRIHVDHCIEMLRQELMCSSDLRIISYDWVEQVDYPWPDFSVNRQCRNFSKVLEWANSHVIMTNVPGGLLERPQDAILRDVPMLEP